MFILYTKFNNVQKRTNKPKNHAQGHVEHNVHSGHPAIRYQIMHFNNCYFGWLFYTFSNFMRHHMLYCTIILCNKVYY